jgi:hypothetical protein
MVRGGIRSRDGIQASLTERLTAADPLDPEPGTLHGAVDLDGLIGISGTGRMETALGTKKRGENPLVCADQPEHRDHDRVTPSCHTHDLVLDGFMRIASTD